MTPEQHLALIRLQPGLRRAITHRFGSSMTDDLVNDANVAIIERAKRDRTFLVAKPAYVVRLGVWRAGDAARKEWSYLNFTVLGEPHERGTLPEQDYILSISVEQALAGVGERTRAVATGIADGMGTKDVAGMLDVMPQAVTYHKGKIRRALIESGINE